MDAKRENRGYGFVSSPHILGGRGRKKLLKNTKRKKAVRWSSPTPKKKGQAYPY